MRHMDSNSREFLSATGVGVNLYGYLTSNVGLGVAARNTLRMLAHNGVPVHGIDLGAADHVPAGVELPRFAPDPFSGRGAVDLFHLNPDRLRYLVRPLGGPFSEDDRVAMTVPFWEAPRLPRAWLDTLRAMDVVCAPTRFVLDALRADLPEINAIHYPQAAFLPEGVTPDRARWDIPEDVTAFVGSFAVASDVERKNPLAIVAAFLKAFGDDPSAMLVLKVSMPSVSGQGTGPLARLTALCDAHPTIRLVTGHLPYRDVLGLYASCDVLVSLHRSEGLGLNMLEAMSLGVPVIATGWSGNMDFMNEGNSLPVPYDLVDIDVPGSSPYHPRAMGVRAQWAEPRIDAAAQAMRTLAGDPALRARLAEEGQRTAAELRDRFLEGRALLDAATSAIARDGHDAGVMAARRRLKRSYVGDYAARIARGVQRRVRARFNS